jgi:hypothetical protein
MKFPWVFRKSFKDKATLSKDLKKEKETAMLFQGKSIPNNGKSKHKGPEVGNNWAP